MRGDTVGKIWRRGRRECGREQFVTREKLFKVVMAPFVVRGPFLRHPGNNVRLSAVHARRHEFRRDLLEGHTFDLGDMVASVKEVPVAERIRPVAFVWCRICRVERRYHQHMQQRY